MIRRIVLILIIVVFIFGLVSFGQYMTMEEYQSSETTAVLDGSIKFYEHTYSDGTDCKVVVVRTSVAMDCD